MGSHRRAPHITKPCLLESLLVEGLGLDCAGLRPTGLLCLGITARIGVNSGNDQLSSWAPGGSVSGLVCVCLQRKSGSFFMDAFPGGLFAQLCCSCEALLR